MRRVSAPGEPGTGQQERRNMGRRQKRNWKLKNGLSAGVSSGLSSGGGMASEDGDQDQMPLLSTRIL